LSRPVFAYPNAYPIDGEWAEMHLGRNHGIEKEALSPMPFNYEPEGRQFESVRAHHHPENQ
jgi:hypothetical protein